MENHSSDTEKGVTQEEIQEKWNYVKDIIYNTFDIVLKDYDR